MKRIVTQSGLILLFVFAVSLSADAQFDLKWIRCGDRTVQTEKTPFSMYGVDVYKGKPDPLLIMTDKGSDRARFCLLLVGKWKYVGFKSFSSGSANGRNVVVFEISNDNVQRYFDIKNGNEVFVSLDDQGKPYISTEVKALEKIFTK